MNKVRGIHCEWPYCREEADVKAPDGKWYCTEHNGARLDTLIKAAIGVNREMRTRHKRATQNE